MTRLTFVFVHSLSGWGSYDSQYQRMPYWGMRGGDHMWLQGGLLHKHDIRDFYLKMLRMIDQLRDPTREKEQTVSA